MSDSDLELRDVEADDGARHRRITRKDRSLIARMAGNIAAGVGAERIRNGVTDEIAHDAVNLAIAILEELDDWFSQRRP